MKTFGIIIIFSYYGSSEINGIPAVCSVFDDDEIRIETNGKIAKSGMQIK